MAPDCSAANHGSLFGKSALRPQWYGHVLGRCPQKGEKLVAMTPGQVALTAEILNQRVLPVRLGMLERALAGSRGPYFCGEALTIADLAVYAVAPPPSLPVASRHLFLPLFYIAPSITCTAHPLTCASDSRTLSLALVQSISSEAYSVHKPLLQVGIRGRCAQGCSTGAIARASKKRCWLAARFSKRWLQW